MPSHRRLLGACAATTMFLAAFSAPALAGPPPLPRLTGCSDACLPDPENYPSRLKEWTAEVRDWATSPPPPPPLIKCTDECLIDGNYPIAVQYWIAEVRDWAIG